MAGFKAVMVGRNTSDSLHAAPGEKYYSGNPTDQDVDAACYQAVPKILRERLFFLGRRNQ